MKTVVITGSARGFGYEMIKLFRGADFNTVLCDIDLEALNLAKENLEKENGKGKVIAIKADVSKKAEAERLPFCILDTLCLLFLADTADSPHGHTYITADHISFGVRNDIYGRFCAIRRHRSKESISCSVNCTFIDTEFFRFICYPHGKSVSFSTFKCKKCLAVMFTSLPFCIFTITVGKMKSHPLVTSQISLYFITKCRYS